MEDKEPRDSNTVSSAKELWSALEEIAQNDPNKVLLQDHVSTVTARELLIEISSRAQFFLQWTSGNQKKAEILPIFVSRDLESACNILACIVGGISFAPLDPDWPDPTLERIIELLGKPEVVVSTLRIGEPPILAQSGICAVSYDSTAPSMNAAIDFHIKGLAEDTRFVLFTSGSTGLPKGVIFDDKGMWGKMLLRREHLLKEKDGPSLKDSRSSICHPFHFSTGFWKLFEVFNGSYNYIFSLDELSPKRFLLTTKRKNLNRLNVPLSLLLLIAQSKEKLESEIGCVEDVKSLTWGGDALTFETISKLLGIFKPETICRTTYGATEVSSAMSFTFQLGDTKHSGIVPMAEIRDSDNIRLAINQENPNHYTVEFSGPMAKGYLGADSSLDKKFWVDKEGIRWWSSGDIVELENENKLWFKSRADNLVKISGKLASGAEVSRALISHEDVIDAVVELNKSGDQIKIIAHLQVKSGSQILARKLREHLSRLIPNYLMPQRFHLHDQIPRNSRGKPDWQFLANGKFFVDMPDFPHIPPKTPMERYVHRLICSLLNRKNMSIDEDFWSSGFDSLVALELETILTCEIPTANIEFIARHNTIESLAKSLSYASQNPQGNLRVFNEAGSKSPMVAFPGIGNRAVHFFFFAREYGPEQPVATILGDLHSDLSGVHPLKSRVDVAFEYILNLGMTNVTILGYSSGGILAFELSKKCAKAGIQCTLVLLDTVIRNPQYLELTIARIRSVLLKRALTLISKAVNYKNFSKHGKLQIKIRDIVLKDAVRLHTVVNFDLDELRSVRPILIHVKKNSDILNWKKRNSNLEIAEVSGNHLSLMQNPHISGLVAKLLELEVGS